MLYAPELEKKKEAQKIVRGATMGGEYDILLFGVTGFTGRRARLLEFLGRASANRRAPAVSCDVSCHLT
jgi:hypothetical protein